MRVQLLVGVRGVTYETQVDVPDDTDLVEAIGPLIAEIVKEIEHNRLRDAPVWQDYDVITVLMGRERRPYTYMRKNGYWPGEHTWTEWTDERINQMWEIGRVTLVIRDGVPLDPPLTKSKEPHPSIH